MFSIDSRGGHNRRKFKADFFEKWSPEMAYVLGFLYADGDIEDNRKSSRTQYTTFFSNDKKILEAIRFVLGSDHNLNYKAPHEHLYANGKIYESAEGYRLRIGSKKLFSDLVKMGLTPRKSLTIKFPADIPNDCLGHFLRGYFDGDGCVFLQKAKGVTKPIIIKKLSVIFTSGSHIFLEGLANELKAKLAVTHDKIYNSTRSFQLRYSTADSIKIFELMYKNCFKGLYLKRKFDIFREYFQMAPRKGNLEIVGLLGSL
jgi:intein/homing endonuclease